MKQDFGIFVVIALGLHALLFLNFSTGSQSSGGGGDARISLEGYNAQMAMMVQQWDQQPEITDIVNPLTPVDSNPTTPDISVRETIPNAINTPDALVKQEMLQDHLNIETIPSLQSATLMQDEIPQPHEDIPPQIITPTSFQQASNIEENFQPPETHTITMEKPITRPESIARDHPVSEREQVATESTQAQTAVGNGTLSQAGTSGQAVSISAGEQARLKQIWGNQIRNAIERQKRYPRKAQSRGERGAVTLSISVSPSGALVGLSLSGSSGYQSLDAAAVDAVRRAGLPSAPAGISGNHTFNFSLVFQ